MAVREEKNKKPRSNYLLQFLRRNFIYLIVLFVIAIGVVATVKIYNRDNGSEETTYDESARYIAADEYYLAMYEPRSFNVLASSDEDVVYLNQVLYSYLFRLDDTLNIVPDLTSEYRVNTEAGTVEITIKNNAYYANENPITSYDVKYTIDMIKELGSSSPYYRYANRISKVEIHDSYTFRITFTSPQAAALDNLVFPIVPQYAYDKSKSFIDGSGQYVYGDYIEGRLLRLVPNPFYYGTKAELPVEISIVGDKNSVPGLITMDAVTAYISKEQNADTIALDKSLNYIPVISGELEYMGFNCNRAIFADKDMRRAIALAIDRESIISDDYGYSAVVSDSLYFPGFLGSDTGDGISYEPKTSTTILQNHGYSDIDEDGILENSEGDDLSIKLIVNASNGNRTDAARSIAENLRSIGVSVEVVELSDTEMKTNLAAGNFDIYLIGLNVDKQFNLGDLYSTYNYGKYSGENVTELTAELEKAHSAQELKSIFSELKKSLYDEMPYFGICYKTYYFISSEALTLSSNPQFFNPYRDLGEWIWLKRAASEPENESEEIDDEQEG